MSARMDFLRRRFMELAVALVLAAAVIQLSTMVSQRQKELLPASAWFVVSEIYVPDHVVGSNPMIVYDRTIRTEFSGFWIVEVQRVRDGGLFQHECAGFGTSTYSTDEILGENEVSWEWIIGRPCVVPPGQYRLRITYTLRRAGWPDKEVLAFSNLFDVLPPG